MITSGKFLKGFNDLILFNIDKYIEIYVPRYTCSFHNTLSNDNYELLMGVNDNNEITGIPFDGDLNDHLPHFKNQITHILKTKMSTTCCLDIRIEIHECELDSDSDSSTKCVLDDVLANFHDERVSYTTNCLSYKTKKKKWLEDIYLYKGKLQSILNNRHTRDGFKKYLVREGVLDRYPEIYDDSYTIDVDMVKEYKLDEGTYINRLIKYKDLCVNSLSNAKPVEPIVPKILNIDYCIVTKLSNLKQRFASNGVRFYVMRIKFIKKYQCNHAITFEDIRTGNWRRMKRYNTRQEGPQCIDI